MDESGAGAPPSAARRPRAAPRNVSFADAEKLVARDRGQKPPMPPMPGSVKGSAKDALAFFTGGFSAMGGKR